MPDLDNTIPRQPEYIPGTCNLGTDEVRRRVRIGYIGLAITILIIVILEWLNASKGYRLLIIPTVFYSLSGFIQARHRFCYLFGIFGVFSMTGRKQFQSVQDKKSHQLDRRTAFKIIGLSLLGALFIGFWYYVI